MPASQARPPFCLNSPPSWAAGLAVASRFRPYLRPLKAFGVWSLRILLTSPRGCTHNSVHLREEALVSCGLSASNTNVSKQLEAAEQCLILDPFQMCWLTGHICERTEVHAYSRILCVSATHTPMLRCQTISSMWALGNHQPVIPSVPFIRWATAFPRSTAGSLWPTCVPVWLVSLTVRQAYAITL